MIARNNRFQGHHSVSNVRGSTISTPLFSVRHAKNKKSDFRLAVVVSKKVEKIAVNRNRIRRRVYELIRKQGKLNSKPIDVVVYIKSSSVATIPAPKLAEDLGGLIDTIIAKIQ